MRPLHAIIMAGGSGTRFWPASRGHRPKQFLPLGGGGRSLLAAAVDRCRGLTGAEGIWIVTNEDQARVLPEILPDFPPQQVILEPEARDTAPCVALALARIEAMAPDAVMLVLPSDHRIEPEDVFHDAVRRAIAVAKDDQTLVIFGIHPQHPATGYGYVQTGQPLGVDQDCMGVVRFREKPDLETARRYLADGGYLWNAGIFVWTCRALRAAMQCGAPALHAAAEAMLGAARAGDSSGLAAAFRQAPKLSIDFAVMEQARHVAVVRARFGWDDLGAFPALLAIAEQDDDGNAAVLHGGAEAALLQSRNNVVYGEGDRLVTLFGVEGLVVVAVDDALLVCPKDRAEDLKQLITHLRAKGHERRL